MSAKSEGRRLIRRFVAGSLVAFLVTGIGAAALIARSVRGQEEAGATFHARTVATEVILPYLRISDFIGPAAPQRAAILRALVRRHVLSDGHVVRVKLWRLDGTILFSDDPSQIGQRFPDVDEMGRIARGEMVSDISDLTATENVGDRSLGSKLFETYVPVRLEPDGPVLGAIEVYQRYAFVQAEINHLVLTLAIAFIGGLAAPYLVLLPILLPTARRLRERNERTTTQAEELREAEAKYRALVEPLPAIVYAAEFERAGQWLYVSPQIEHILGFTPQEWTDDPNLFDRQLHP